MIDLLVDAYTDPRFLWVVVGGSALSMLAFAAFATPLTLLAARDPAWARRWRVQDKPFKVSKFAAPALGQWLLNSLLMFLAAAASWPLMQFTGIHLGELPPLWLAALQIVAFILLDDFLYYWMHRAMHRGWLWKHIHKKHHRVVTPFALTGHYMHPVEFVLTGTLMLVGPAVLGAHVAVLFVWIVLRQWEATEGHCGYRFPLSPTVWLPAFDGPDHHDFHHSRFHGNYAGYLPHVDRWLHTESKGYPEHVQERA